MSNPSPLRTTPPSNADEDLQWRLSQLTPADSVRGMFLNGVVDVVRTLGDEAAVRQCLESIGEKKFVDFFQYPSEAHLKLIYTAAKLLEYKYGTFEKTLWTMGYQGTKNFFATPAGKMMLVLSQGIPKRLLNSLPAAFTVAGGTLKSEMRWLEPNHAVFVLKRDFIPLAYTEGVLQAVMENAKVKSFQVRSLQAEPLVGEYDLTWE